MWYLSLLYQAISALDSWTALAAHLHHEMFVHEKYKGRRMKSSYSPLQEPLKKKPFFVTVILNISLYFLIYRSTL